MTAFGEQLAPALTLGDVVEVQIEKLVYGGEGLARYGKQTVFVPLAAPGARLRIRITQCERNFARGVIEKILEPSSLRRQPPCPHFGQCGGCQLQHLELAAQHAAKAEFVRESLRRLGQIEWTHEIPVRAADEFGYRSRAEIKVRRDVHDKVHIGYYQSGTREICEVRDCAILLPSLNRELQRLHDEPALIPYGATRVHLTAGDDATFITPATGEDAKAQEIDAQGTAQQNIAGMRYEFGVRSFFQGNRLLVESLVEEVVGNTSGDLVIDLYAGVGLFALQLAQRFAQVVAVEGSKLSAAHGLANVKANNIANVHFDGLSVEAWLKHKSAEWPRPDLVILDPPRAGAGLTVIERLAALDAPQLIYVSCDPATLARDLKALLSYGYHLDAVTAFDLFPQTFHVETIAKLSKPTV
ncbi:MAG: class I SAM-dependent RNA methyltransferase [Acidobacteria bacterium]|nr:class I SAM-dependent RNA methyltransferase [Acidobacteriota bacterium]